MNQVDSMNPVKLSSLDWDYRVLFLLNNALIRHAFSGLPVCVMDQGKLLHEGIARGIDATGCLQLETDAGLVAIAAGDLSLRAASTNKA
jgi:biotin-(acetyl-CoA carboxylase) ligase